MGKYAFISTQTRIRLIEMVQDEKQNIKNAADILQIKFATAKSILRSYKKHGKIMDKNKLQLINIIEKSQENIRQNTKVENSLKKADDVSDSIQKQIEKFNFIQTYKPYFTEDYKHHEFPFKNPFQTPFFYSFGAINPYFQQ